MIYSVPLRGKMKEKHHYVRNWIVPVALMIAVFSLTPTRILTNSAYATIDVQARQKAAAVMNLIDQSLGFYVNATGSPYIEHLPTGSAIGINR